jgi:hypothetical protein
MKTCVKCGDTKSKDLFSLKTKNKDGLQNHCKQCAADYQKDWHQRNKSWRIPQIEKRRIRLRNQNRIRLVTYLQYHPCTDCGEIDPVVLQFDHVRESKERNISKMVSDGETWKVIVLEIRKCEVRCANCHLKATARRGNFYKTRKEFQFGAGVIGNTHGSEP